MKLYKWHLKKFLDFTKIRDYDALAGLDSETIQALLENYAIHLKRRNLSGKTVEDYFSGIELFFECNKKFYYKKALHKMFPEKHKTGNHTPYTTKDVRCLLTNTSSKRIKALIHFFASTGARPSTLLDPILRFKHIHPMPFNCKAVLLYSNTKDEFWAFLTPEATKSLEEYRDERIREGEVITQESPVFITKYESHGKYRGKSPITYHGILQIMTRLLDNSEVERIKEGYRYDKAVIYGFRKRFNTIMKLNGSVNSNIAEKLMAHKKGLDGVYFKPTREECFKEFVKAIPDLTVDENERLKQILEKQNEELKNQPDKDRRITELEKKLEDVYRILSHYDEKTRQS
ncbi:MAG: site-specific integrase [Thaumarchaeota archaeon]|nr:site-specific integrase [Nitrososphaerota archaeon]